MQLKKRCRPPTVCSEIRVCLMLLASIRDDSAVSLLFKLKRLNQTSNNTPHKTFILPNTYREMIKSLYNKHCIRIFTGSFIALFSTGWSVLVKCWLYNKKRDMILLFNYKKTCRICSFSVIKSRKSTWSYKNRGGTKTGKNKSSWINGDKLHRRSPDKETPLWVVHRSYWR